MSSHPYKLQPSSAFWGRAIGAVSMAEVDPVVDGRFKIRRSDKVVTAGSCFAQHISRRLSLAGFTFHVTESAHPILGPDISHEYGYGVFSARYGNIYTARQLLQLHRRAYGEFLPVEDAWMDKAGRYIDPFRPSIQPGGFVTLEEMRHDRDRHLSAVRRAFEEMDVFVFTLGLTESWESRTDGAVFPVCPGVVGGEFDPHRFRFQNFSVQEIVLDILEFARRIATRKSGVRYIITVSPVPLMATAEPRHVLVATTYSKSVLRVAAEQIERELGACAAYFPSYEIICGNFHRGRYFADDLRSVTEEGVSHVMRLFLKHYGGDDSASAAVGEGSAEPPSQLAHEDTMRKLMEVVCDEEALAASAPQDDRAN